MSPQSTDDHDPWMQAWHKLKAFIDSGATQQQVTGYARELGRDLPDVRDPEAHAAQADAVQRVVRDILDLRRH